MDYIGNIKRAFQYAKRVSDSFGYQFQFNSAFFANANACCNGKIEVIGYNDVSCQVKYFGVVYSVLNDWARGFVIERKCLA